MIGKAIYYILANTSGVTSITSTRIFPGNAPQQTANPCLIYNVRSTDPNDTQETVATLDTIILQIDSYSDTAANATTGALTLAEAVRAALDRKTPGTYNGVIIRDIIFSDQTGVFWDDESNAYRVMQMYKINMKR